MGLARAVTVTLNPALDRYYTLAEFSSSGHYRTEDVLVLPAGKGINVARVITACGALAHCMGVLGGLAGQRLARELTQAEISHDFVWEVGETRTCITIRGEKGQNSVHIIEPGIPVSADAGEQILQRLRQTESRWVVVAGNPEQNSDPGFVRRLICAAKERRSITLVDMRPPWLHQAIAAQPDMIKPNREEFVELVGPCTSLGQMARRARDIVDCGVRNVLVSLDRHGLLVVTQDEAFLLEAPAVDVVSSIGCGDTLVGAFVADQLQGRGFLASLVRAEAAACASANRLGAGLFDPKLARQIAKKVRRKDVL